MSDPFRLRVLKRITEVLKGITPANGYSFDLSDFERDGVTMARVYRGRTRFGREEDPLPLVSVLEHPAALDQIFGGSGSTSRAGEWDLLIQGFVVDDAENPTDPAHMLVAEVIKALAEQNKRFNVLELGGQEPCVMEMKIGSPIVRPEDDGVSDTAYFFLVLNLTLAEDLARPFS